MNSLLDVSTDHAPSSNQSKNDEEMGNTNAKPITSAEVLKNESDGVFPREIMSQSLLRKVLAEIVGTFILVFCICAIIGSTELHEGQIGLMEYITTAVLLMVVIIYAFGPISGGHANPAFTIALATSGQFPWSTVPVYVTAQVGGSLLATYAGKLVYDLQRELVLSKPHRGRSAAAFSAEFIGISVVVFTAAALSDAPQSVQDLSGFVLAGAFGLGVLITAPVSGTSLNPARSLGPAIVYWEFGYLWIYLAGPTLGAVFGGILYRLIRLQGWSPHPQASKRIVVLP